MSRTRCPAVLTVALVALSLAPAAARAGSFVVSSSLDTGGTCPTPSTCTLRQAISSANAAGGADSISFGFGVPTTISPATALPAITGQTALFASQLVELSGAAEGAGVNGIQLASTASNSTIDSLTIDRFPDAGIVVDGADTVTIRGCTIGTDNSGAAGRGNGGNGITVRNGADIVRVGTTSPFTEGNTIVGNGGDAINVDATSSPTSIVDNVIGFSAFSFLVLPNAGDGIDISGPSNTIGGPGTREGNEILSSGGVGVRITGPSASANTLVGNTIGVDASDRIHGNTGGGVVIDGASGNRIGDSSSGVGNTISGNDHDGVSINGGATNTDVVDNRIGTDAAGAHLRPNDGSGVQITSSPGNTIGEPGAGNVISGNLRDGIGVENATAHDNVFQGNRIGTNAAGTIALPNERGISAEGANLVGGAGPGQGNLVSGNVGDGIEITNTGPATVQGNLVGTNGSGTGAIPNGGAGIVIDQPNGAVGGPAGAANTVAFNLGPGIRVKRTGDVVAENAIFANGGLGIDLDPVGVNLNDPGDGDAGLQNFPDLSAAVSSGAETVVHGAVNSNPGHTLTLRFSSNPDCDPSGFGEARTPLASTTVTTDGAGNASFEVALAAGTSPGQLLTATATGPEGTSELSACRAVEAAPAFTISPAGTRVSEGQQASLTVTRTGATGIGSTIAFATADGSATAGSDFAPAAGTLTFTPGETTKTITVPITDDSAPEGDEAFTVTLSSPTHATLGSPASAQIVVAGNDREPDSDIARIAARVKASALRSISGTAVDADGDLARVEVAIFSARGGAHAARAQCLNVTTGATHKTHPDSARRCHAQTFLRATGTARWTLRLTHALPKGTWVIESRATDATGRRETSFSAADHNRAVVSVR